MSTNDIADRIVRDLFTNGCKDQAERLVLTSKDGKDLGGWCQSAVRDVILRHLKGQP